MMLSEYVITPDVFDVNSYINNPLDESCNHKLCGIYLGMLKTIMLEDVLIRDLHNGKWSQFLKSMKFKHPDTTHKILKTLTQNQRLIKDGFFSQEDLSDYKQWFQAAISSHTREPLTGIIASRTLINQSSNNCNIVSSIDNIDKWFQPSHSIRLKMTLEDYKKYLYIIFNCSNSLMFIDPYLEANDNFVNLLSTVPLKSCKPKLEIHVKEEGEVTERKHERRFSQLQLVKERFSKIEIYYWCNFHDRYLISNLIGISLPYGFTIFNSAHPKITTWIRLNREDKDDIQNEFSRNSTQHTRLRQFTI